MQRVAQCLVSNPVSALSRGKRVLFVHGGPGFHAQLERAAYGDELPVCWWDQPHLTEVTPHPLEALVDAVQSKAMQLAAGHDGAIGLLANSFGSRVVLELLRRNPEYIDTVTISAGILDIGQAACRLAESLLKQRQDPELEQSYRKAKSSTHVDEISCLLAIIFSKANVLEQYFGPGGGQPSAALTAMALRGPLLDAITFSKVLSATLDSPIVPLARPWHGHIEVLIGRFDPYARSEDGRIWTHLLPGALISYVDTGHFPHLELAPEAWLSTKQSQSRIPPAV